MGDILEHIMARRSIRKFEDRPVPRELVTRLLQAAMAAPSAGNLRPWEFVVVTERDRLARLRRGLPLGRHNAPLAIVVCANTRRTYPPPVREFWVQDCSAAAQNILLAAAGSGLGAVWVGVHPMPPFVAWVRDVLHLPGHIAPLGMINIGFPAQAKPSRTQYDARRVHWEEYGPPLRRRRWWQFWRRDESEGSETDLGEGDAEQGSRDVDI